MPKTTAKPSALPISGQVSARSPYGVQLEGGPEDGWYNLSKPEYRDEPWEWDDVQKGDWVEMTVSGGKWIKSIALTEPPTGEPMVRPDGAPQLGAEDPFEGLETISVEGEHAFDQVSHGRNPIATDRERSIQRQVALKAAVELAIGMAGPTEGQRAGPLNAAFVVEIYRVFRAALEEE